VSDVERVGGPARGYSWKTFTAGHEVSLKHGGYSPRRVGPLAAELLEHVTAEAQQPGSPTSYLSEAAYRPALTAWAECEARIQLVREFLLRLTDDDPDTGRPGDIDGEGAIRPAAELLLRLENQALKHRERLGLDPLARARLGRDVAGASFDLARMMMQLDDDVASDVLPATGTDDGDVVNGDGDGED